MDSAEEMDAIIETGAAAEVSMVLTIPRAMNETRRPASIVSRDTMDDCQTSMTTNEDTQISTSPVTRDISSKENPSTELSNIDSPAELVEHAIPLVGGMQQPQTASSHTVSSTELVALTELSSVGASTVAGTSNQENVLTIISPPKASKDPVDLMAAKEFPKKKNRNNHEDQRIFASKDHCGADAKPSHPRDRISGETKSAIKQTVGAPSVDQASCMANAEPTQVEGTPSGNARAAISLPQKPDVPLEEHNGRIQAAGEKALSGVPTRDPRPAAGKKGRPLLNKRRTKNYSPGALSKPETLNDAGNDKWRPPKNQGRETSSQPGGLLRSKVPRHVLPTETGLSRNTDTEQTQASQAQAREENPSSSRRQNHASPLRAVDETAIPQTLNTSRPFNKDLDARLNGPAVQPSKQRREGDNFLAEKEVDNSKVEGSKGKPTRSQRKRRQVGRKKEQARAAAGLVPGKSIQPGLAQAQPNHSPQPHTAEQPSQPITITNANLAMTQDPSVVMRQPIPAMQQVQDLLHSIHADHRKPSRSSAMASRGNRYTDHRPAQGRVFASGEATNTGSNLAPSFGHQVLERRQRGFQPQSMPAPVDQVPTGPHKLIHHQRQHGTSATEGFPAVAVPSPAVQSVTTDASTPEADPVHVGQAPSASVNRPSHEAKSKSAANNTPRPQASVRRSATSTTLVGSPPAATSSWDTPNCSPEHLDWSKSITPNSFSYNNLPTWSLKPTFSSRERRNSMVHPQPALAEMSKDIVPIPAKILNVQTKLVQRPTLKENEIPFAHPMKPETQKSQPSQRRDDGNGIFIPPHLRPPRPPKQLVDVPSHIAALTALADLEEEDAHLPPHLRRPARKEKALEESPVYFAAAVVPQEVHSEKDGHLGNQTQHSFSTKTGQGCVATPWTLLQDHDNPTITQMAVTTSCVDLPIGPLSPAVRERAQGRSKAVDNIGPSRKVSKQDSNAGGSASIDSNVAVNDGETRPRTKLQYEPQLHDWEGNWAPAPVEWDARPSFDNTDTRHMKAMEGWMDERAEAALNEPIQINIHDPYFLNGGKPAGGLEKLDSPVEEEVSETLLPDDPFTHARIHQTAKDSAIAYTKKLYKEKKTSKEDRKAIKIATRLHYESYVPPPNPHVPKANIYIRPAVASDMRQITQIYNHYVKNSVVTSERVELTESQWQMRWRDATGENFAFLVAVLKSGNRGGRLRRDNVETIVGFAYAEDYSESGNMYRFTCELQFWVHHLHLRHGVGKTLVDRMLAALDNGYYCRQGTDFIADDPIQYEGGGLRSIARILISIPHDHDDAKDLTWQKKWLSQWQFEQVGNLPGIGRKFGKDIDVAHLMKITSIVLPKGS